MGDKIQILLVEDDINVSGFNERKLRRTGYDVLTAETLAEARHHLKDNRPDLIVLDVMLPDGSGFDLCTEIRKTMTVPVLFLTGKTQIADKIEGLNGGGDYYMTKPYDFDEFTAVVASLLRRAERPSTSQAPTGATESISQGSLVLDTVSNSAMVEGKDLLLTPKEFALLSLLVQNMGKSLTGEFLYEKVWNVPMASDGRALWAQLSRLRKKLEATAKIILHNDRNTGYYLEFLE